MTHLRIMKKQIYILSCVFFAFILGVFLGWMLPNIKHYVNKKEDQAQFQFFIQQMKKTPNLKVLGWGNTPIDTLQALITNLGVFYVDMDRSILIYGEIDRKSVV